MAPHKQQVEQVIIIRVLRERVKEQEPGKGEEMER